MIQIFIFLAIVLFSTGVITGIFGSISGYNFGIKVGVYLVIISVIFFLLIATISPKKPQDLKNKTLTQVIFENSQKYHKVIIYYDPKQSELFDVDIDDISYDNLTLDSLKMSFERFPNSIYSNKKQ